MSKQLAFWTRIPVRPHLWFLVFVLLALLSGVSAGQQQTDSGALSADQAIQILQANPDLLSDAKAQIQNALRERGISVTESDITDDRLYSRIRSDDRVRLAVSNELKKRGYGPQTVEEQTPSGGVTESTASQVSGAAGNARSTGNSGGRLPAGNAAKDAATTARQNTNGTSTSQRNSPYGDLPALQDLYSQSVDNPEKLERFGASLFRNSAGSSRPSMDIPVGSDYVLGPGDEVVVSYWGSSSQRLQLTVDREGRLALPEAGAILVAGSTLGQVQQLIQKALARQFRNVSVDVSLGRIRTVRVYVVGDVKSPGAYQISALSTALSALLAAGGPNDTGSLRTLKHYRGKKLVEEVDLYELMLNGVNSAEARIESGDSILVPPAGAQVTVAGMVRRPAIYELRNERTLDQVLELAGGVLISGELRKIKVARIEAHERKVMLNVNLPQSGDLKAIEGAFKNLPIRDGDYITISPILPYSDKTVYLQGHVFRPGKYPYRDGIKVTDLIGSFQDLLPEPADHAEIVRLRPPDYRPSVIGFNLRDVLEKRQEAPALHPFDTVRVFGRYEADAPKVAIYGEVLRPEEYLLSEGMTATDLLRMAGGFKRSAYTLSADLSSYSIQNGEKIELEHREIPIGKAMAGEPDTDVLLKPGDVLTIRQLGKWNDIGGAIIVQGEVLHPGRYGIQEGERLSSILERTGGLLQQAYPNAAILEREQVKQIAVKSRDDLINKLQTQALEGDQSGKPENPAIIQERQQLVSKLKDIQPNGRLVIHIGADVAKWKDTSADIEVRSGDKLIIPKKPNFVLVAGQVYNPTATTFAPGKQANWYLKQAGGPTDIANKKQIFIVRANGSVVGKGSGGMWSGNVLSTVLQPGDMVYVPEKVSGGNKLKNLSQSASMLSGLALAARVATSF